MGDGMLERDTVRHVSGTATAILEAVLIALAIRTFLFQPFNIPSGSMEPTLLVGDYLFVSKFSYGYSRYSFPIAPPLFSGRVFTSEPSRGDVVVFRGGEDDFIKRVIGLPHDRVQVTAGVLYINDKPVERHQIADFVGHNPCRPAPTDAPPVRVVQWRETLPNGISYNTLQCGRSGAADNTGIYTVPARHFFMMGDNRENSADSRFPDVGYVPLDKLIGRAQVIFFSIAGRTPVWELWNRPNSVRWNRIFTLVR
jgi:signal peptidase I